MFMIFTINEIEWFSRRTLLLGNKRLKTLNVMLTGNIHRKLILDFKVHKDFTSSRMESKLIVN